MKYPSFQLNETTGALSIRIGDRLLTSGRLFTLNIEGIGEYVPEGMNAEVVTDSETLFSVRHTSKDGIAAIRTDILRTAEGMRVSLTAAIRWPDTPQRTWLRLNFLNELRTDDAVVRYPLMTQQRPTRSDALQPHGTFPMPLSLIFEDGTGAALFFDVSAANLTWDRLCNRQINNVNGKERLQDLTLILRVDQNPATVADILIHPFEGGWKRCFEDIRAHHRKNMDLTQYRREDLSWMRSAVLSHFAFVYGDECFDYEKGRFDMARLLDQGEEFGGYDNVLIWHQYPRLGLDERSQWDFFEEFPGGLAGLREAVETAHARGVKVLLPFKPWDHAPSDNDADTIRKLTHVMRETDADGLFFDTMNSAPAAFREALDKIRPGLVFVTEKTPDTRRSVEAITASWDQYWHEWAMPEVPLFRYLFPEHGTSMIARWHVGVQKDNEIKRAMFNGTGIVIWQDIFGAWLPFDAKQKKKIARWKEIYLEYRDCFEGNAIPLLPTERENVFANLFEGEGRAVLALFHESREPYSGLILKNVGEKNFVPIENGDTVYLENGDLYAELAPREVTLILLTEGKEG